MAPITTLASFSSTLSPSATAALPPHCQTHLSHRRDGPASSFLIFGLRSSHKMDLQALEDQERPPAPRIPRSRRGKTKNALQLPKYPNPDVLDSVLRTVELFPPIVFAGEARSLEERLGQAAMGNAFLLQGGDCAERFKEFNANNIRDTFRVILQMSVVLMFGGQMPVIKVGSKAVIVKETRCWAAASWVTPTRAGVWRGRGRGREREREEVRRQEPRVAAELQCDCVLA